MTKIKYEILVPLGGTTITKTGDLHQFINNLMPMLGTLNIIPPFRILNDILTSGYVNAGMSGSCKWEPFKIDMKRYNDLIQALKKIKETPFRTITTPYWVRTRSEWHAYIYEEEMGIPSDKHLQYLEETEKWAQLKSEALKAKDKGLAQQYHSKIIQAGVRLSKFLSPYFEKYQKRQKSK
jgi:hypothetical protein